MPLYRQMQRFERSGVKLSYSTLTDWVSDTCKLIVPLFDALKREVLQSNYLHADETPIKVMDKDKKGEARRGYYWVYRIALIKLFFSITRRVAVVKAQWKYCNILKGISKPMDTSLMMFLIKKKAPPKYIVWRMQGECSMMHWTMTRRLLHMPWGRSTRSYMLLREIANGKFIIRYHPDCKTATSRSNTCRAWQMDERAIYPCDTKKLNRQSASLQHRAMEKVIPVYRRWNAEHR